MTLESVAPTTATALLPDRRLRILQLRSIVKQRDSRCFNSLAHYAGAAIRWRTTPAFQSGGGVHERVAPRALHRSHRNQLQSGMLRKMTEVQITGDEGSPMVEAGLRNERVSEAGTDSPGEQSGSRRASSFPVAGLQLEQRYFPNQTGDPTVKSVPEPQIKHWNR